MLKVVILTVPPDMKLTLLKVISPPPPVAVIVPSPKAAGVPAPVKNRNQAALPVVKILDESGKPVATPVPPTEAENAVDEKGT
jgi:hypothetical protein